MKVQILCFSPSGNTLGVAHEIQHQLQLQNIPCELTLLTRDCFGVDLTSIIPPHDLLIVGGPVYAHHLHYNVLDTIQSLPTCDSHWGKMAIPFVTYGGISSGIALYEAGKSLQKSGRNVIAGLKVAASHRMTRAFMETEFNSDLDQEPMKQSVQELVKRISEQDDLPKGSDVVKSFSYFGLKTALKARFIFQEKKWHRERYPQVIIDPEICSACGKCATTCPVGHLRKGDDGKMYADGNDCIHCLNCVVACPKKAIRLKGDLTRGRLFMAQMIERYGNQETPATAVYPLDV